jgi:hypothetical protein
MNPATASDELSLAAKDIFISSPMVFFDPPSFNDNTVFFLSNKQQSPLCYNAVTFLGLDLRLIRNSFQPQLLRYKQRG